MQAGDTLQSIAQALWGDSRYWYLLADANGLSANTQLVAGELLNIPAVAGPSQNNASTSTVYNPAQAQGNTSPTHAPPPPKHGGGCGVFGEIALLVVAVVVAAVVGPEVGAFVEANLAAAGVGATTAAIAGSVAGLAVGGAVGSAVSQGVGLATGLQSKFSWSAVGEAAISAAIGGPGPNTDLLTTIFASAAANALTQGVEVATGLQSKFNWGDVAGAAVGAGVSGEVGGLLQEANGGTGVDYGLGSWNADITKAVSGVAGAIANAATRTLVNGTDFGDNLVATLPDAIGQTIGNAVAAGQDPSNQELGSGPIKRVYTASVS